MSALCEAGQRVTAAKQWFIEIHAARPTLWRQRYFGRKYAQRHSRSYGTAWHTQRGCLVHPVDPTTLNVRPRITLEKDDLVLDLPHDSGRLSV